MQRVLHVTLLKMFFNLLNNHQKAIAASCVMVLAIVQISLDAWTLYKIQEHEELTIFLSGNSIPKSVLQEMTYDQALSYFIRMKDMLRKDILDVLGMLQMTAILGVVAGILELFTSFAAVMWKGTSVDVVWLGVNFIVVILLSVSVSYIGIHMIRDVLYHQVLLTVTTVNLFVLVHIWIINLLALIYSTCLSGGDTEEEPQSRSSSLENMPSDSRRTSRNSRSTGTTGRDTTVRIVPEPPRIRS